MCIGTNVCFTRNNKYTMIDMNKQKFLPYSLIPCKAYAMSFTIPSAIYRNFCNPLVEYKSHNNHVITIKDVFFRLYVNS